jgi:hypothetical protein
MKKIALALFIFGSSNTFANEVVLDDLSSPTIELISSIHEFCVDQHTDQDEGNNIENFILNCINADLKISMYKTFNSYSEITSFITQDKGE